MRRIYFLLSAVSMCTLAQAQQPKDTAQSSTLIQEQVVNGIRANEKMPVTQITLTQKQIEQRYYGADIPTLLNITPSINSYSDNGTGIGYSYFRLRGLDQTRVNLTLNGIPVNDAEMQGTYFNNFADLASSAQSIQIQRGVGTSSNGTASYAGSINITTKPLSTESQFLLNTGFGSFNSRRMTAEYQTGLLANKFAFSGRISDLSTDGYREHSGSHIRSMFLSGAYFGKRSVLKFNILSGSTESQLSYTGIDQLTLAGARRTNPFTNKEMDGFNQNFYQLQYSYKVDDYSGFTVSGYYVHGNAPRFQYFLDGSYNTYGYMNMPNAIVGTDTLTGTNAIGSYRLNQDFYGGFANYYYKKGNIDFNTGVQANTFSSQHFMEINWAQVLPAGIPQNYQAYTNTGHKSEMSAYAKLNYKLNPYFSLFGDLQVREASFTYKGHDGAYHHDTYSVEPMQWVFINPKLGTRFTLNRSTGLYVMYGITTREPTRNDYFLDDYPHQDIKQNDVKPETVYDLEVGVNHQSETFTCNANYFFMDFRNQLVNTGRLNAYGTPITTNVASSYRAGVEVDFTWRPVYWLYFINSSMFMKNQINSFTQYFDSAGAYTTSVGINYKNVSAALTPDLIINQGIRVVPQKWIYAELNTRFVSKQYLDNTQDEDLKIQSYTVMDLKLGVSLKKWIKAGEPSVALQVNNITDVHYTPSGNTTGNVIFYDNSGVGRKSATGLYFPAATRNIFVTVTWKF